MTWRQHPILYLRRTLHDEWIGCVAVWKQEDIDLARAEAKMLLALFLSEPDVVDSK